MRTKPRRIRPKKPSSKWNVDFIPSRMGLHIDISLFEKLEGGMFKLHKSSYNVSPATLREWHVNTQ